MFNLLPNWFIRWCSSLFTDYINQLSFKLKTNRIGIGSSRAIPQRRVRSRRPTRNTERAEEANDQDLPSIANLGRSRRGQELDQGAKDMEPAKKRAQHQRRWQWRLQVQPGKKKEDNSTPLFWSLSTLTSIKMSSLGSLLVSTTTMLLTLELRRKVKQK